MVNIFFLVVLIVTAFQFSGSARAAERQIVHTHIPAATAPLQPLGLLEKSRHLNLAIGLPLRNQETLSNLLQQIYDPSSPNYHHYLTPEQFAERFGPTEQDYQSVIAFANTNGFTVTGMHPNRMLLDVNGSVADIERVMHVTMHVYQHPTEARTFYAPDAEPSLDLTVPILGISGLNNYSLPRPLFIAKPLANVQVAGPNAGSGPGGTYMGNDFRAAYAPDSTLNGSGQIVGLLQFDGYTASDITYYEGHAGLPGVTLTNVLLDGFSGNPTGSGGEVEVSLDIEMAISMATNLSKVIVYEAGPSGNWHDILNRMATDNLARQLSCSWYIPNGVSDPVADGIFEQMAAQGQSFFAASGDNDAYTGLIPFPGDTPYITQVGGTTLTTSGLGGSWTSETVWNWGNGIGSGGGISTQYPIPSWQTNINMTSNQGSTTRRNTPDVALTADNVYVRADGVDQDVGGTSCAAPLWAGFAALINQQAAATGEPAVGFLNPAVDAIGTGPNYTNCFHDITTGNNTSGSSPGKFYAVSGYDLCTGWGTPNGQKLINALANPEALQITPTTGFTSIGGVGGPFTVASENFSLTNVGTNSLTWTLSNTSLWLNASSSSGTLIPGTSATNVTISLNSVASNLLVGTYSATVWFTNLNDHAGQSRQFTLTIISPPTITTQPTNQAVLDGATATFTVAATGGMPLYYQWQYNSNNLTDGGNVSGSATTNLTINNATPTNVGYYSVIVSNAASVATSTNALLTIIPSQPVITQQPADESVVMEGTAQFTVVAVGTKPFSYQWSFNGTNNPVAGATNATLTLANVQFTNAGIYAVVITNIYGPVQSSNANLTVLPCDPDPAGMVSWWRAEGNANDSAGTNNGTAQNISYTTGEVGQAFSLNGASGYVSIPNSPSLNPAGAFSIEGWIFPTQDANQVILSKWGDRLPTYANNRSYQFETIAGLGLSFPITDLANQNNGAFQAFSVNGVLTLNTWNHVAATYDSATGIRCIYVNGVKVASLTNAPVAVYDSIIPVTIGTWMRSSAFNQDYFQGSIDELSFYGRALSQTEIQDIYLAGSGGKCFTPTPPVITSQPTNETVIVGGTASFSVSASGTPPLSYQWTFDTTNITGATNATLTLTNAQFTIAGVYAVVVSNIADFVVSSNAILTVNPAPSCDPDPAGMVSWWRAEGNANDSAGTNNGTAQNISYTTGEVGQAFSLNGASGYVSIPNSPSLNPAGAFSIEGWIFPTQDANQVILSKWGDRLPTYANNRSYQFETIAGLGLSFPITDLANQNNGAFQAFSVNGVLTLNTWNHVAATYDSATGIRCIYVNGVKVASLTNAPVAVYDSIIPVTIGTWMRSSAFNQDYFQGSIDELSFYGRALSQTEIQDIYLAGSGGKCFTPTPPVITSQPTNETVIVGGTASFSVSASGTPPLSYQWTFDTTNITGATNATLTLTNAQFTIAGVYAVVVSNIADFVVSSNAILTVMAPPAITTQPTNQTVYVGGNAGFSVTAIGSPPLSYQWNFDTTNIASATNATLTLKNVQPNQAGNYTVLAANSINSILSSNAVLTVNPPPALGVAQSGGFLLIFWPVSAPGFVLETSPTLSPANWVPVPNPPIQIGNEYLESIELSGSNFFYRLQLSGQ